LGLCFYGLWDNNPIVCSLPQPGKSGFSFNRSRSRFGGFLHMGLRLIA
jgi:hypothetical protein